MGKRACYALAGYAVAAVLGWLLRLPMGRNLYWDLAFLGGPLGIWIGERTGRLDPIERSTRPITLFPGGIPGPK